MGMFRIRHRFPSVFFLSGDEANMLACYANARNANAKLVSESGRIRTKLIGHEHESKMLHNNLAGIVRVTLGCWARCSEAAN